MLTNNENNTKNHPVHKIYYHLREYSYLFVPINVHFIREFKWRTNGIN